MKKVTRNLQLSRQKTVRILAFFDEKAKINKNKDVGFLVDIKGDHVTINCKRLATLCDEYTDKQLRQLSGQTPDPNRDKLRPIEAEAEVRGKALKKHEPFRLPSDEEIGEASLPKLKILIGSTCKDLYERGVFPKANAFANKCLKYKANARAVLHTLNRVSIAKPEKPWAYAVKIMSVEDQNFHERDFNKTT